MEFCSVAKQLKQNLSFVQFVFCCRRARPTRVSLCPRRFCCFRCLPALCGGPHPRYAPTVASGRVPSRQNRLPCFGRRALRPARWSRRWRPVRRPVARRRACRGCRSRRLSPALRSHPAKVSQVIARFARSIFARPPALRSRGARPFAPLGLLIFSLYLFALTGLCLTPAPAPSGPPPARSALNRSLFFWGARRGWGFAGR